MPMASKPEAENIRAGGHCDVLIARDSKRDG
jgi:hypothetical protein